MNIEKLWKFEKYSSDSTLADTSSDKHFGSLDKQKSLVRESIQNSLDAIDNKDVEVKIKIRHETLKYENCETYF